MPHCWKSHVAAHLMSPLSSAYVIANSMYPGQTAPSGLGAHSVCFSDEINIDGLNICSRNNKSMDKNVASHVADPESFVRGGPTMTMVFCCCFFFS